MTAISGKALEQLAASIAATRPFVLQAVQRLIANRQDAEDVAQEAIVAALSNLHGYRGDAKLTTWLYRVGQNAALMEVRRRQRAAARTARALCLLSADSNWLCGATTEGPHDQLERRREAQFLHKAVAALPSRYRAVIAQWDLDERPVPNVASRLGLSSAGIRTRRLRAIALLRAWLTHKTSRRPVR
jgi:RNA polymerase sigma-70 factor (ECF subfamily)